jgi:hypothetical protein
VARDFDDDELFAEPPRKPISDGQNIRARSGGGCGDVRDHAIGIGLRRRAEGGAGGVGAPTSRIRVLFRTCVSRQCGIFLLATALPTVNGPLSKLVEREPRISEAHK